MDNLTHSLVGLVAAKAGLERWSPYATFVCVAAANLPDSDIVALARGPAFYLQQHRGITHSIVGTLALAVVFPLLFCAGERVWARVRGVEPRARLKGLLACSLLLTASHPLLDWTNSYGVRPFLPWDGRWVYGDLLFVVDPWVWLVLGGTCFLLARTRLRAAGWALLALAVTAVFFRLVSNPDAGVRAGLFLCWCVVLLVFSVLRWKGIGGRSGERAAAAALVAVAVYCGVLSLVQTRVRREAEVLARELAARDGERVLRVAATPVLADPLDWRCLMENERSTARFETTVGNLRPDGLRDVVKFAKPSGEDLEVVRRASETPAARVLLDFARFPVARVVREDSGGWVVQFADLRFTEPGARGRIGGFALDVPVGR